MPKFNQQEKELILSRINDRISYRDGCHIWTGAFRRNGQRKPYPLICWKGGRYDVHRIIYQFETGQSPKGIRVYRICHNTLCVNPKHIHIVLPKDKQ